MRCIRRSSSARRSGRGAARWDRRAEQRNRLGLESDYTQAFLERMNLEGVKTALDIGCGTGNLALPLARKLRKVYALDFSPEMLRHLKENTARAGVDNIVPRRLSWTDPWTGIPKVDIALCSRAMGGEGLRTALEKMNRKARLRCYLTLHSGGSFLGDDVLALLDRDIAPRPDYIYAVNILYQMGIRARVDFLQSTGGMAYASADLFVESIQWRIGQLSTKEKTRLRRFYRGLPRGKPASAGFIAACPAGRMGPPKCSTNSSGPCFRGKKKKRLNDER